ncbi:MAG: asparagine synthase-related protein, partial [Owenweeksia sp.]
GDSSAIPTTLVSAFAKKHVKVSLSADGGDELFGGYGKYFGYGNKLNQLVNLPKPLRKVMSGISAPLVQGVQNPTYQGKIDALQALLTSEEEGQYKLEPRIFGQKALRDLLVNKAVRPASYFDDFKRLGKNVNGLNRMLAVDYKTYMIDDILTKVDRATMSVSLEGREPLLDHRLAEFLARLPGSVKTLDQIGKGLLKRIVHNYVPRELMERPKKGFGVPLVHWFQEDLKDYFEEYLSEKRIREMGIFNARYISELKQFYYSRKDQKSEHAELAFTRLWYLLCFEMWREKWGFD